MGMRLPARTDYAIRAAAELAGFAPGGWMKGRDIARAQRIPYKFLMGILRQLTLSGIVESRRGSDGGFRLARPAQAVSLAEVVSAVGKHQSASAPAASTPKSNEDATHEATETAGQEAAEDAAAAASASNTAG